MGDTKTIQDENAQIIEEMLSAKRIDPLSITAQDRVINKGEGDAPLPMVVKSVDNAVFMSIYDTITGEMSLTHNLMLRTQLDKRRPDGSRVFTTNKPKWPVARGTMKCYLHPDDPNRSYYDSIGFPVCQKSNLTSAFQVKRHMQKRHPMEWQAIEDQRKEKVDDEKRAEDREFRSALFSLAGSKNSVVAAQTDEPELYVSPNPKPRKKRRARKS